MIDKAEPSSLERKEEPNAKHVIKNNKSSKNKISEITKLSIDSTLWTKPTEIVLLDDINLNKISTKGKYISKYDLIDYTVRYDGGGFWLSINDLEGYFEFNNNIGFLELIFKYESQESLYDKIRDQAINNKDNKVIKDSKKIRLSSDDLPSGNKFKIITITIVIKSIVKKVSKYYPQISLNNCTYKI